MLQNKLLRILRQSFGPNVATELPLDSIGMIAQVLSGHFMLVALGFSYEENKEDYIDCVHQDRVL